MIVINKKLIIFASCDSCLNALKFLANLQSSKFCLYETEINSVETFVLRVIHTLYKYVTFVYSYILHFFSRVFSLASIRDNDKSILPSVTN